MRKIQIILLFCALVFVGIAMFFFSNSMTGNVVEEYNYSFTKAVCNETNYCEDYEIHCSGAQLISFTPTGAAVQYPDEWEDKRTIEEIQKECN